MSIHRIIFSHLYSVSWIPSADVIPCRIHLVAYLHDTLSPIWVDFMRIFVFFLYWILVSREPFPFRWYLILSCTFITLSLYIEYMMIRSCVHTMFCVSDSLCSFSPILFQIHASFGESCRTCTGITAWCCMRRFVLPRIQYHVTYLYDLYFVNFPIFNQKPIYPLEHIEYMRFSVGYSPDS